MKLKRPKSPEYIKGIEDAVSLLKSGGWLNPHHMNLRLDDCILFKLNLINKSQIRKNK